MKYIPLSLIFLAILWGRLATATLGGQVDSIEKDSQALKGTHTVREPGSSYTVHEIRTPSLTIREYLNSNQQVFAVAWNGVHHPDLKVLLGSYYDSFQSADKTTPRRLGGRKHIEIHSDDLTVVRSGHMRNLGGKAMVTSLMPKNVTTESIR